MHKHLLDAYSCSFACGLIRTLLHLYSCKKLKHDMSQYLNIYITANICQILSTEIFLNQKKKKLFFLGFFKCLFAWTSFFPFSRLKQTWSKQNLSLKTDGVGVIIWCDYCTPGDRRLSARTFKTDIKYICIISGKTKC